MFSKFASSCSECNGKASVAELQPQEQDQMLLYDSNKPSHQHEQRKQRQVGKGKGGSKGNGILFFSKRRKDAPTCTQDAVIKVLGWDPITVTAARSEKPLDLMEGAVNIGCRSC